MRALPLVSLLPLLAQAVACASGDDTVAISVGRDGGTIPKSDASLPAADAGLSFDGGASVAPDAACAEQTISAQSVPLDLYVMLDRSGSMTIPTNGGASKWQALKNALAGFFADPKSKGIGIGLQLFPTRVPGLAAVCANDAVCGSYGPCMLKACASSPGLLQGCHADADCAGYGPCIDLGACDGDLGALCFPGMECNCVKLTQSFCQNQDSCSADDYASPKVAIAPLPGVGPAVLAAMSEQPPMGGTPTAPALAGAVKRAHDWSAKHSDHIVAAVLASDGLPTECAPTDIPSIAEIASDAAPLRTFVIGVLGVADTAAAANLDQIAVAGGTGHAYIVDAYQNLELGFRQALDAIRASVLGCKYSIPAPVSGGAVDFDRVNVSYSDGAGNLTTLYYVGDAEHCDPVTGGWYYDADPASGATPSEIVVCQASCNGFDDEAGSVDIRVGCKTMVAPPA